jgi:hypothetical protein
MSEQLMFPMGTLHVCPKCGVEYRCDEEDCEGKPGTDSIVCPSCCRYFGPHSQWGGHRARCDPVWAAKLARIQAMQRSCSQPLQIVQEKSPCDLTRLDEVSA